MSTARISSELEEKKPAVSELNNELTALEKHIAYFADANGKVTYDSIRLKLIQMGKTDTDAAHIANIVSGVGGVKTHYYPWAPFTPEEGKVLRHARDTKIYNADGTINEAAWRKLLEYSEMDGDVNIITRPQFNAFLKWSRDNDDRWDVGHFGEKASNGEWEDYFGMCKDHWKQTPSGPIEAAKISTLRKMFENAGEVFDRVVSKELPLKKPGF